MYDEELDRRSDRPLYLQLADVLRGWLDDIGPGGPLLSEADLMRRFAVSRDTARRAVQFLEGEGLLQVRKGLGTFVRVPPPLHQRRTDRLLRRNRNAGRAAFVTDMADSGREPDVDVVVSVTPASADIARRLDLAEGTPVLRRRRRMGDGQQILQLADSHLPMWIVERVPEVEQIDTGPGGTYKRLEDAGFMLVRYYEELTARPPTSFEGDSLQLAPGVPVLCIHRTAYAVGLGDAGEVAGDWGPVELTDVTMPADRWVASYVIEDPI